MRFHNGLDAFHKIGRDFRIMSGSAVHFSIKLCPFIAVLFLANGCILNYSRHDSRGASLSDAMHASANGGGTVSGRSSNESSGDRVSVGVVGAVGGEPMVDYGNLEYFWQVPVDAAYSIPLNGEIQSLRRLTISPIAIEENHHFLSLFISGDIVNLQPGSLPASAVDHIWMMESGIAYRFYFTPAHSFISPYFSANASYQLLSWDYRSPIVVGSDVIESDALDGVGGYAGFGIAIKRNSRLSFFGEAGFGGTVFLNETHEGFNNDVFSNFGYFTIKAGVSFKF
jgi:hypothetical protein